MKRYAIWNKQDEILTPVGEVFTPEEWMERYPVARLTRITVVCAAGEVNGAFFGTLGQMKEIFESRGCDFSACTTNEEILETIEAFEDAINTPSTEPTPAERQAQALEAIATGATSETTAAMNALLTGEE